uniref:Uncharacterized protein n=1 Tax=Ailuropoda melanoleuca TaxID=9646 RepID=A0A7N5KA53_AILME
VYFGRKRYILYAFFSFCRFPVYFLRLQRSLCHQPWDLRPRGCLVGSEEGGEAGVRLSYSNELQRGAACTQRFWGPGCESAIYGGPFASELT